MLSQHISMLPLCRIAAAKLWCGENPVSAPRWWKGEALAGCADRLGATMGTEVCSFANRRFVTMRQEDLHFYLLMITHWIN